MKAIGLALLALLAAGCGGDGGGTARSAAEPEAAGDAVAPLAAADSARLLGEGADAANALAGTLVGQLTAAVERGGPAGAIDFCAGTATALTDSVAAARGVVLRRTSLRLRNPANAPDADEREVLAFYDSVTAAGAAPPPYVLRRAGNGELRYYRPLLTNAMCVRCHGPVDALDADVVAALREKYPDDRATGYGEQQVRGVLRVSLPE